MSALAAAPPGGTAAFRPEPRARAAFRAGPRAGAALRAGPAGRAASDAGPIARAADRADPTPSAAFRTDPIARAAFRATAPAACRGPAAGRPDPAALLCAAAVALSLLVSANLLAEIGIPYAEPGGDPLEKFHPATWCVAAAVALVLRRDRARVPAGQRDLARFFALMAAAIALSVVSVGPSGAAVYVESFLAPGGLAYAMGRLAPPARRAIGSLALWLVLGEVGLALVEVGLRVHLVPIRLEDRVLVDAPGEFRSAALFDHPLTAAMATMTALLCLPALRAGTVFRAAAGAALAVGLLAFGGRAAIGATAAVLGAAALRDLAARALARRLTALRLAAIAAGAACLAAAVAILLAATSLGGRIEAHFYLDQSAQSRGTEWLLPGMLDLRSLLFGTPIAVTPSLIYRLGLQYPFTDIENFWLMAFIDLGAFGFALYLGAIACLLRHLWRVAGHPMARVAILALLAVASTSNSLGRKCNVLLVLAALVGATEAAPPAPVPARGWSR